MYFIAGAHCPDPGCWQKRGREEFRSRASASRREAGGHFETPEYIDYRVIEPKGGEIGMLNGLLSLERERFVAVLLCKAVSGRSPGTAAPVDTTSCEELADPSPEVRARSLTSELQGHNPQEHTHRLPVPREKAASDPTSKA